AARSSAQFGHDIAKLEHSFLPDHPPRRPQRSAREAFAATRCMPQGNRVGLRIKTHLMGPRVGAGAACADRDLSGIAAPLHLFDQLEQCSVTPILFSPLMHLPTPNPLP